MIKSLIILPLLLGNILISEDYFIPDEQVLSYDIPPSVYLEKLSEIQEKRFSRGGKFMTAFWFTFGSLFFVSAPEAAPEAGGPGFAYFWGALCFGMGIKSVIHLDNDLPKSLSKKRYVEVMNEPDMSKREIKAYNSLVWLAKSSSKIPVENNSHNRSGSSVKDLFANIFVRSAVQKSDIFNIEQRALDGFLTQMPIDVVF